MTNDRDAADAASRRSGLSRSLLLRVGLPLAASAAAIAIVLAVVPRPFASGSADSGGEEISAAVLGSDIIPFSEAWDRLEESGRAFVVTVIGDSTGNEQGEWVDIAFRELAEHYDRPLIQHPWDVDNGAYLPEIRSNADGANAPIEVWNGSASGKTGEYSLAHFGTLVPAQPDAVIVNHGLNNVQEPARVGPQFSALVAEVERHWPGQIGFAAILENPRFDQWRTAHEEVINKVKDWLEENRAVRGIDVNAAYRASGDYATLLLPDLLHPSAAGSALTAATVLAAIES